MDTDEDLRAALELGCAFALVRVRSVGRDRAGTRSQTAVYEVDVERPLDASVPPGLVLKHFGPPLLQAERVYLVGAVDSGRHHGAWELRFAAPAPDPEAAVADLAERRARLER